MPKELDTATMDAALGLLAPIVSHEIRNPLAIIGNSAYFIKVKLGKDAEPDPKVLKHLGIIEEELVHANGTLSEILAYARMRAPALQSHPSSGLLQSALNGLGIEAPLKLEKALASPDPRVMADGELVTAALRHILRNALQAASSKGGPATVSVATRAAGSFGEFDISDTGPGIPAEAMPRLFEPFNTTKPRGIGLGMAYAKKVVLLHKGEIALLEGKGPGAAFRIRLPLASSSGE